MAVRFSELKSSILIILYDYMLTSDHEGFWYDIPAIQEALPPDTSGAFVQRALDALISEGLVEQGGSDRFETDLFALSDAGIDSAEKLIEKRGISIESYEPAPELDELLSRVHHPVRFSGVESAILELTDEIKKSNSFETEMDGNGDLVEGELAAANKLLEVGRVRVSRLKGVLMPTLSYLARKFADSTIGELSKRLIALLMDANL